MQILRIWSSICCAIKTACCAIKTVCCGKISTPCQILNPPILQPRKKGLRCWYDFELFAPETNLKKKQCQLWSIWKHQPFTNQSLTFSSKEGTANEKKSAPEVHFRNCWVSWVSSAVACQWKIYVKVKYLLLHSF